ncbi:MAG: shikimate kinase AroK [Gammaproteobacteria bacterium]
MKTPGSLFLVGPMGAGKSTIGRQLARALHMPFHDSDREIEQRTGVDIPLIFELEGEQGFRRREHEVIDALTAVPGIVLATGGGAILDRRNRDCLADRGTVVYLHTSVDQQLTRTGRDRSRPLLQTEDPRTRLEQLMAEREPLYREIADVTLETDGRTVRDVVKEILGHLKHRPHDEKGPSSFA